jgi:uncharacterized SAM-binding protein YcdF (DUF218 family)
MNLRKLFIALSLVLALVLGVRFVALPALGAFLVATPGSERADAAVVLSTGADYYPRLMEAAAQYRAGRVALVVINGDRKTDALRELEALGYQRLNPWDLETRRILEVLGVPGDKVVSIAAEDAFDTISEARAIAPALWERGMRRLLVVTSRFHTRRAVHIWRHRLPYGFSLDSAPARRDPFDPGGWWLSGRQVRQVMAEYGGWVFYYWSLWRESGSRGQPPPNPGA